MTAPPGTIRPLVLATDLDGTFAHGTAAARTAILEMLARKPAATLVYVTGRTPDAARTLARRVPLPEPNVLIADVGTSVLHRLGPEHIDAIETDIEERLPGIDAVRERLAPVAELEPQDIEAPRRVSYWIEPVRAASRAEAGDDDPFAARAPEDAAMNEAAEALAREIAANTVARLEGLQVDVVVSANVFLDVLPRGVNKGTTLRRVLRWLDAADDSCIVAGDSLNDLALFETGLRGIAVGNCEPALRRRIAARPHIYQAAAHGAEGVLEGLRHHGVMDGGSQRTHDHGR